MAAAPVELSRREREAVEAQRKKDHYMKLHAEGKTQEAQVRAAMNTIMSRSKDRFGVTRPDLIGSFEY